jgi:hypothetical protein
MQDEITWQEVDKGFLMPLKGGPKSPEAVEAVDQLFAAVIHPKLQSSVRPTSIEKYRRALGALFGDLCRYRAFGVGGKHGMSPKDFPSAELGFGRPAFMLVTNALIEAGHLDFKKGWNWTRDGFAAGNVVRSGGSAAFFRLSRKATKRLGELCGSVANAHWFYGRVKPRPDAPVLLLRAKKVGGQPGVVMNYSADEPGVRELLEDVTAINAFLGDRVEGIAFGGLRRIYNDGDALDKRWRRGGRYYSQPGGEMYESMGKYIRLSTLRLDGEPAAEVDIRASHLTVLYAVHHIALYAGEDPYDLPGVHRAAVKAWVTTSFGKGSAQWNSLSRRASESYAEAQPGRKLGDDYKVAEVRQVVVRHYPWMHDLSPDGLDSLDLAWHEAEILRHSMQVLREEGIASLPVHDSLIVPASRVDRAMVAMTKGFELHFESDLVKPRLRVERLEDALNI